MPAFALVLALGAQLATSQQQFASQPSRVQQATPRRDVQLALAESLLVQKRLVDARRIAEALQDRSPDDPHVLVLLARIHLAWPIIGRFEAESLLRRAADLEPGNPEPLYYLGKVGEALGADDGEAIARTGFVRALTLDPEYRDSWARWNTLYRGGGERRAMISILDKHHGNWNADYWRGQLLVEQDRLLDADSLLGAVVRRHIDDPGPWAWLARARFAAGHDRDGWMAYQQALAHAERDTGAVLWRQVRGIASAAEKQAWVKTPPEMRGAFFRRFWAGRNPDLAAPVNPRMVEHFQRLSHVKRMFALLHPSSRYFQSPVYRALAQYEGPIPGVLDRARALAPDLQCTAHPLGIRDSMLALLQPRLPNARDSLPNLDDDLDDRGLMYLRHGPPKYRLIGNLDQEVWCYVNPDGSMMQVSFVHRHGYQEVTPLRFGELEAATLLMATDESSMPADLSFTFWPATFQAGDRWRTELLLVSDSMASIATLIDDEGNEVARDTASGRPIHLTAEPGHYLLLLNGRNGAKRGRYRTTINLPDYTTEPTVSSLLLASGTVSPVRDTLALAAPRDLVLPAAEPLRVYAEIYNLGRRDSLARYVVDYHFERLDGFILPSERRSTTVVSVPREVPFLPRLVESLVIDPGRLPPGRYRLSLQVSDEIRGTRTSGASIVFRLR